MNSTAPYEYVYQFHKDPFREGQVAFALSQYASNLKFRSFMGQYKAYKKSLKSAGTLRAVTADNPTAFTGQPLELNAGQWTADDEGIRRETNFGEEWACAHAILPVERLVNIDTGEEKMRLAYKRGVVWRNQIVDKRVLASASKITELSSSGVLVTSENAKPLIRYLSDLDALNYDVIPEAKSVGRLGHISGEGFSPYVEDLIFDGDASYRPMFEAVRQRGSFEAWKQTALECSRMSLTAKILLAASFASPLLEPLGALPFFVHLWGVDSGTGKTVGLMLAASVWGDPQLGAFVKTFDATQVGTEVTAAFLNNLPLCLDELQLVRDRRGETKFDVYKLAQGVGRLRGAKTGGVAATGTWRNTILTTGESPLTGQNAGAGAVNRVIDIECASGTPVITDGRRVSAALKTNYGHAGRKFVEALYWKGDEIDQEIRTMYDDYFKQLNATDTTEKQAMAAAAILTGWVLARQWIFQNQGEPLTVEDISSFLASKASVSLGQRGYEFLCDWVAQNEGRFSVSADYTGEVYGELDESRGEVYIIRTVFNRVVEDAGFSQKALLSYLRQNRLIRTDSRGRGFDIRKKVGRTRPHCVALKLPVEVQESSDYDEIL